MEAIGVGRVTGFLTNTELTFSDVFFLMKTDGT